MTGFGARAAHLALLAALSAGAFVTAAAARPVGVATTPSAIRPAAAARPVALSSGVRYVDLAPGEGAAAGRGRRLTLHYRLMLADGSVIADTRRNGRPLSLRLGGNQGVRGLEEGLLGMRSGGRRRIEVPAPLGYGNRPLPGIPPGSDLVFLVELISVE